MINTVDKYPSDSYIPYYHLDHRTRLIGVTDMQKLETIPDVIAFCKDHDLPADVVGRWVWLRFESKPDEATRTLIKGASFRWVKRRGEWAHNCGHPTGRGGADPRWKYGHVPVFAFTNDEVSGLAGLHA